MIEKLVLAEFPRGASRRGTSQALEAILHDNLEQLLVVGRIQIGIAKHLPAGQGVQRTLQDEQNQGLGPSALQLLLM